MDKSKLIEDLITTRLMSGNVTDFITELKQADVTPAEAKTADLFGDPRIGELVGGILDNLDDITALEPALGELQTYLRGSTAVTEPVKKSAGSDKENFSMDKPGIEEKMLADQNENLESDINKLGMADVMDRMGKLDESLASLGSAINKLSEHFSEISGKLESGEDSEDEEDKEINASEDDVKAKGSKVGKLEDASGDEIDMLDPNESHIDYSESGVTVRMSYDKYARVRRALDNLRNFAEVRDIDEYEEVLDSAEDEDEMISIPRSEYMKLKADLKAAKCEDCEDKEDESNHAEDEVEEKKEDDPITLIMKRLDAIEAKLDGESKDEEESVEAPVESSEDKEAPVEVKNQDESRKPEELTDEEKAELENHSDFSESRDVFSYIYG